jgi:potassium-transporting ATPase KdpC subunit
MKTQIIISIKILLVFTVLTGIIYPLIITGIAQLTFPTYANGSLVIKDKQIIGSEIIGQNFSGDKYFWPRPSAVNYNPLPSGGSNYGMTSQVLKDKSFENRLSFTIKNKLAIGTILPGEMIYSSASGLDPHISVDAAKLQVSRISRERNMDKNQILQLIAKLKENRQFYILGEERVNVLLLNIELDKLNK